ncbi:MAG: hypothetical protein ABW217_10015 [Polyangiaceae bacterium]
MTTTQPSSSQRCTRWLPRIGHQHLLRSISLVAGLGIAGCNLDSNFAGLGDSLLDPDAQGIESPGRLLVAGEHTGLRLVDDPETGERYVLSRMGDGELSVFNLANQQQCTIPQALTYDSLAREGLPTLVAFVRALPDGNTELAFADFDCQLSDLTLPFGAADNLDTLLVADVGTSSGVALLMRLRTRAIVLVDPWSQEQIVLEEQADEAPYPYLGRWWWRAGGEIIVSDARLERLLAIGSNVSEWRTTSGDLSEIAFIERSEGQSRLFAARPPDFVPQLLEEDACAPSYATPTTLAYFAPCSERRLTLNDRGSQSVRSVADGVVAAGGGIVRIVRDQGILYLTNPDPQAAIGTLWLLREDAEEASQIGENAGLGQYRFTPDGGLVTLVDATNEGSRLIHWKDGEVQDIAERVREIGTLGVLANFDGRVGELLEVAPDFSTQVIATGVPAQAAVGNALLTNFDGTTGELVLVDQATGALEPVASGVPPRAFLFGQQFDALILLADRDAENNTTSLVFRLLDTKQNFTVSSGVTEAREVSFPAQGLLYNVLSGDAPGIWFAKVL